MDEMMEMAAVIGRAVQRGQRPNANFDLPSNYDELLEEIREEERSKSYGWDVEQDEYV